MFDTSIPFEPESEPHTRWFSNAFGMDWGAKGWGHGQLYVELTNDPNKPFRIANECMDRESCRKILISFVNKLVDIAILEDDDHHPSQE